MKTLFEELVGTHTAGRLLTAGHQTSGAAKIRDRRMGQSRRHCNQRAVILLNLYISVVAFNIKFPVCND